jgi:hypothetical protein
MSRRKPTDRPKRSALMCVAFWCKRNCKVLSIKSTTKSQLSCCACKPVVCTSSPKVDRVIKVQQQKNPLTFTSIGTILSNWIDWPDHLNRVQRTGSFLAKVTSFRRTNESLLRIQLRDEALTYCPIVGVAVLRNGRSLNKTRSSQISRFLTEKLKPHFKAKIRVPGCQFFGNQ